MIIILILLLYIFNYVLLSLSFMEFFNFNSGNILKNEADWLEYWKLMTLYKDMIFNLINVINYF